MKGKIFATALMTGSSLLFMSCAAPLPVTDEEDDVELTIETVEQPGEEALENNGHFFVKVDDKIYFHVPSETNLESASWFGEFAPYDYGDNVLMSYDPKNKKALKVGEKATFGNIFVMDGKLYTNYFKKEDGDMKGKAICYDLANNYEEGFIKSDSISAVDKEGKTLVTSIYSDGGTNLSIHSGEGSEFVIENVKECVACEGDKVFYVTEPDYGGTDEYRFWEYDLSDNKSVFLGYLPESEKGGDYYDFHQLTVDEEHQKVFFTLNYYSGAKNELTEVYFISATLGKEESLSCERTRDMNLNNQEGADPTAFTVASDGKMNSEVKGRPFYVTYDKLGHLIWYDKNCEKHIVDSKEKYGQVKDTDTGAIVEDPEIMEYIDGKIYIMRNILERAREDDMGWRMAYKRREVRVYSVDVNTGEETDIFNLIKDNTV